MSDDEKLLTASSARADQMHAAIDEMLPYLTQELRMVFEMPPENVPTMVRIISDKSIALLYMLAAGAMADAYERKARRDAGL